MDAVFSGIAEQGSDATLNLRDRVAGPLEPTKTANIPMLQNVPSIRGNHDRELPESLGKGPVDGMAGRP